MDGKLKLLGEVNKDTLNLWEKEQGFLKPALFTYWIELIAGMENIIILFGGEDAGGKGGWGGEEAHSGDLISRTIVWPREIIRDAILYYICVGPPSLRGSS